MRKRLQKAAAGLSALMLACTLLCAVESARAKTLADWMEGFESGSNWFGEDFAYDITDTAACWELLQRPIIVLDEGERARIAPLTEPNGRRVNNDKHGGRIIGSTAAVHVLGEDENGWTLIEGLDEYDRLIRGYVRTRLLKTVTPNPNFGIIVDKLTQRLYMFVDGELFSSCAVSTGLPNDEEPYNETASGEYLISSWVGTFENNGLICEKAIRFNGGDLFHQVPYTILADGTQRFSTFESRLGSKASLGCIRVARYPNEDGFDIHWMWDNLKKNTKVVIWDDDGRRVPYPAEDAQLYYNKEGGTKYHFTATCSGVRARYHPLSGFLYSELDTDPYQKLDPCDFCTPPKRKAVIDQINIGRGVITRELLEAEALGEGAHLTEGGAVAHPVEIVIVGD